jgi:hypothetical protein
MARQTGTRILLPSYAVLGDGKTELFYLKHLKKVKNYKYKIQQRLFNSITIETAKGYIDKLLSGGCDQIIFITDYDTIVNQKRVSEFEEFKLKYVDVKEVVICENMPCVEFWFLLHYKLTTHEFNNAGEVIEQLLKHIGDYKKKESYLKNSKWVETLCNNGKFENAISNSKSVLLEKNRSQSSHFPFSKMHIAIDYFEKQKINK